MGTRTFALVAAAVLAFGMWDARAHTKPPHAYGPAGRLGPAYLVSEAPFVPPAEPDAPDSAVWITVATTPGDRFYHRLDCRLLGAQSKLESLQDASSHGLAACPVCNPDGPEATRPPRADAECAFTGAP